MWLGDTFHYWSWRIVIPYTNRQQLCRGLTYLLLRRRISKKGWINLILHGDIVSVYYFCGQRSEGTRRTLSRSKNLQGSFFSKYSFACLLLLREIHFIAHLCWNLKSGHKASHPEKKNIGFGGGVVNSFNWSQDTCCSPSRRDNGSLEIASTED